MGKKMTAYIALLHADGTEPDKASGYQRVCIGEVDAIDIPTVLQGRQIVFPDVTAPGYGYIAAITVSDWEKAGAALWVWPLPEPMDVHKGVVPVIHNGKLYRGMEVQAKAVVRSADLCGAGIGGANVS